MTAEIAILNKSAIALAADSAVTIQSGNREEKTYDSADKLFELCYHNAIGVMVYNGLSFAEVPLQTLIKRFRSETGKFEKVEDAARHFLEYLNSFGAKSPKRVKDDSIKRLVFPILDRIEKRFQSRFQQKVLEHTKQAAPPDFNALIETTLDEVIATFERIWGSRKDAQFVGGDGPADVEGFNAILAELIEAQLALANDDQRKRLLSIAKLVLQKDLLSDGLTGIVIAGFGTNELFPTLISFEIDGMVGNRLKYSQTNLVDIDRNGPKARVIPFAQKEMVDRFLYGLDDEIERLITAFCTRTAPDIRKAIVDSLEYDDQADKESFEKSVRAAEEAFVEGLRTKAFHEIRTSSQAAIDGLIEFMPKPELAKMAEALVNLTSIKKRVSRGMDTVGGPIDVAVISQAEGFVWVKRKHYFPADLNPRYLRRVDQYAEQNKELRNDEKSNIGGIGKGRRSASNKARPRGNSKRPSASNQRNEGRD